MIKCYFKEAEQASKQAKNNWLSMLKHSTIGPLKLLGVAALYALLAKIVLVYFSANGVVSIVWPPSGLALAVLLMGGKRYFPGVFLGAFLANAMTGLALSVSAAIATGNTLEALLGAWLLTRNGKFDPSLRSLHDYLRLVVLAGLFSCSVAALNGATILLLSGFLTAEAYFPNLLNWWMGDTLGIMLVTPFMLVWRRMPDDWLEPKRVAEAALVLSLTLLVGQMVFLGWFHDAVGQVARGYWIFLFVTWAAVRLEIHGVVAILIMTAIQGLLGAVQGVGFFADDIAKTGLANYWFFMMALSVVGMALATYFTERERMERMLRRSEETLNRAQTVGQIGSWFLNIPANRLEWSAETYRIFGIPQREAIDLEAFVAAIHPDDRDFVLRAWGEAMAGAPYDVEHRIVAGGQERWVRERAQIERDSEGRPLTGIGTVQDITERKQAEAVAQRFGRLLQSSFNEIYLFDAYSLRFLQTSEGANKNLGYSVDELNQLTPLDLKPLLTRESFEQMIAPLRSGEQQSLFFETVHRRKDGTTYPVEVRLQFMQDGVPVFLAIIQDITERKNAEEELRASEQKFMRLFMLAPIPLGVVNKDGIIVYFNDRFTEAFGYTTGDVPTLKEWWQLAYPDESYRQWVMDSWGAAVAKAAKEGTDIEPAEYRVACKGGTERIILIGGIILEDNVLATFIDITERSKAEEELRTLSTVVEQSPLSVVITDLDANILYVNPHFINATGYSMEEVIGQNPRILQSGLTTRVVYTELWNSLASGKVWCGELVNKRKNGELYWEEAHIAPATNSAGVTTHYVAVKLDITQRKQAERVLAESEERFRLLVESSPFCIHEIDLEGRFQSMNSAGLNMLGLDDAKEICGMPYLGAVSQQDAGRVGALLRDAATNGIPSHFEFAATGDVPLYFKSCFIPIKDINGKVLKLMGITEDITERKQAEEQIRNLAFYDTLTQLPNRRLLNDRLGQTIAASKRSGRYGALMFLDMDNFKPLNDTYGHDVGDLLLVEAARRIASCVREVDTVARFGGDEFVVMLSELDADKAESAAQAGIVAEKIRAILAEPYLLACGQGDDAEITVEHHCTSSIGVALFINHEASPEDVLKWADMAMYQAKEGGRNLIRFFDSES